MSRPGVRKKMVVCEEGEPLIPATLSDRVTQLIGVVRPSKSSEERRNRVAKYVRKLIADCFAPEHKVEAFMFGSVPLRTYLPDGDIDVSIFCEGKGLQDCWGERLQAALEKEADNPKAIFQIANVQLINAEVKLLKCLVDNIVVDMSFNQIGGLCTLNFLEAMDRRIGGHHLFKRSVILIKAWCYYESRVLGAQYSLLSTYALETMVLYIFNVHHAVLRTPLEVLYKFLVVFHQFEWDKYCLTLSGPVLLKNLEQDPSMPPAEHGTLLSAFMNAMLHSYSYNPVVPTNTKGPAFPKFINIMDPLLHTNNLGRSVSKTSEVRIRNAFGYAAGKLTALFKKAEKDLPGALDDQDQFFRNTWNAQCRPRPLTATIDVPASVPHPTPEDQILEQSPKDAVETASLGHPTAFPGFPGFPGVQVTNAQNPTYPPHPPPPPPTHRPAAAEEPARRPTTVAGLQIHPPPPPGPPPTQPMLASQPTINFGMLTRPTLGALMQNRTGASIDVRNVLDIPGLSNGGPVAQTGVADAVIGTAVGQVDDRSALDALAGMELNSSTVQLPGFDQWGRFNPWLMGQPLLVQVAPCYQVQPRMAAQEVAGTSNSSAVRQGAPGPLIPTRQEGTKPLARVRSAPNLGEVQQKRRDRNLNRRILHPHPLPYPRKWPGVGETDDYLAAGIEGAEPSSLKPSQIYRDEKSGLILPNTVLRPSNLRRQEIFACTHLDDKVLAKLEQIEVDVKEEKKREKQAAMEASREQVQTACLNSEPPTPSCEEPPDPASDSPKVAGDAAGSIPVEQGRIQDLGQPQLERNPWNAAPGKQSDVGTLQHADLNSLLQVGNLVGSASRHPVAGNRAQVLSDQQMQAMMDLNPTTDMHTGYMCPGFYTTHVPQFTPLQVASLCGVMGLTPQLALQQSQRPIVSGRGVGVNQIKHNQSEVLNPAAVISELFSGGNYQHGNVVPVTYLNNPSAVPHNAGGTTGMLNIGDATVQSGCSLFAPAPHCSVIQQSNPSWGFISQGAGLHGQKASIDSHSDAVSRDQEDVLAGDLDGLTKNLEVARNCVGRKQDRSKVNMANRGGPSGRSSQRGDSLVSGGHHRKRHPHTEESRGFGIRTQSGSYEHRGGRSDRSQERQHNSVYQGDGSSPGPVQSAYGPMMYVGATPPWGQPPPPPPTGTSENQVIPLQSAEDIMYQLHTNLNPHAEGYFIQPTVVTPPVVTGAPVTTPGMLQAIPSNAVAGMPAHMSARRENQGNSRGHRQQWRPVDEGRHAKPLSVSTQDGTRVEIDPLVYQAVEAALAGTGMPSEVTSHVNGPPDTDLQQPPYRDDHHRNPPADMQSPRSARSKSTDGESGVSNGSQRNSVRKQPDGSHAQRPAGSDNHCLQNPPVIFGGVAPGSVDKLTYLANGTQGVKGNTSLNVGFDAISQMSLHGSSSRSNSNIHTPDTNFFGGRSMQMYGTGGFIPLGSHFLDRQKPNGTPGPTVGVVNGGDPPGSRATPDGDPQSIPEADHGDDGCWSSISAGSDRAEEARPQPHSNSRRYPSRYNHRSGGSKSYQHDYSSRPPRYYRNQGSYWNGGDQWYRGDRAAVPRDVPDFFPDYGHQFFFPESQVQNYVGGYRGGYIRQEQDFEQEGYPSFDQQRHVRGGFYGWKGGHRREKEEGRWYGYGHEEKTQTDGSSTPDSQGSHNTARSQSRSFARRDMDRWDGNKLYSRGHRRMEEYSYVKPRRSMECHLEENIVYHNGRQNGDYIFDPRTSHHNHHGRRSSHDQGHRGHHRHGDSEPKPFAFQEEDFPALEATRPFKVSTPHSQIGSPHGTPKRGDLNPVH